MKVSRQVEKYCLHGGILSQPTLTLSVAKPLYTWIFLKTNFRIRLHWDVRQSSIHIAWVDSVLLRALNKVLSDLYSFMFFLSPSPIFWCQTLQSGGTAAGAHILHSFSTFPSSSSLRLPLFTSLSSSCPGLQATGPVSSFPLVLHPDCKNLPRMLPTPPFLSPLDENFSNYKISSANPYCYGGHTERTLNLRSAAIHLRIRG